LGLYSQSEDLIAELVAKHSSSIRRIRDSIRSFDYSSIRGHSFALSVSLGRGIFELLTMINNISITPSLREVEVMSQRSSSGLNSWRGIYSSNLPVPVGALAFMA